MRKGFFRIGGGNAKPLEIDHQNGWFSNKGLLFFCFSHNKGKRRIEVHLHVEQLRQVMHDAVQAAKLAYSCGYEIEREYARHTLTNLRQMAELIIHETKGVSDDPEPEGQHRR